MVRGVDVEQLAGFHPPLFFTCTFSAHTETSGATGTTKLPGLGRVRGEPIGNEVPQQGETITTSTMIAPRLVPLPGFGGAGGVCATGAAASGGTAAGS